MKWGFSAGFRCFLSPVQVHAGLAPKLVPILREVVVSRRAESSLTARRLERAKSAAARGAEVVISDGLCPGLSARFRPDCGGFYRLRYSRGDDRRTFKLADVGTADEKEIDRVRRLAWTIKEKLSANPLYDPAAERAEARREAKIIRKEAASKVFEAVALNWLNSAVKPARRTAAETERILFGRSLDNTLSDEERRKAFAGYVVPEWRGRHIRSLRRGDVAALLDKMKADNGPEMARKALEVLRSLFSWYEGEDEEFTNPVVRAIVRRLPDRVRRERTLQDRDELRRVWRAAGRSSPPIFGALVRALLLTGARREEIVGARWDEIQGNVLVVPPERVKKTERKKEPAPHAIPLTDPVLRLLETLPRVGPYIFTTAGAAPFSGYSKAKRALDNASGVSGWTLHDLRRTFRSLASDAGCNAEHAELAIGHKLRGVRQVYDRFPYLAERRTVLEAVAKLVGRILDGATADVVIIAQRRAA